MTAEAEVFDLQVLSTAHESGLWVSATSRLGSVLALPASDAVSQQIIAPAAMSELFRDTVATGARNAAKALVDGDQLRQAVFGIEEVGALLRRTRGAAAAAGSSVLVRLFAAPASTAAVPWELVTDPDQPSQPLAMAVDVHLARAAQVRTYSRRNQPLSLPINVLLSNPTSVGDGDAGFAVFDHYEEGRSLLAELQPLQEQGLLKVVVEDRPSIESLRRKISAEARGFHIIHYLGHARPEYLKLESADGRPEWVRSYEVGELLRRGCPDLRLVVFAGCQTAVAAETDGDTVRRTTTSITDGVVQNACPNVVGMQAVLPFRTEQLFARSFYQAVCAGRSIAHAVNLARVAIRADSVVGGDLLDWAVPILVTGDVAGPLIRDGETAPPPPPPAFRSQLKLGLDEPDREFFARFAELRAVLDVLCSCRRERIALVSGSPGVGKTRLLARALDELTSEISYVLYVQAPRLARAAPDGTVDSVGALCALVAELLGRGDASPPARAEGWSSIDWWERLVEELIGRTFVLAIEDIDRVSETAAGAITDAIANLVQRRSRSRVVLTAQQPRSDLLGAATQYAALVRLEPVTQLDVEQWIARNQPGLRTYLAQHPDLLPKLFRTLSSRLELWASLAQEIDRALLPDESEIIGIAERLESRLAALSPPPPAPTAAAEEAARTMPTTTPGRARTGPLRVVVAGPHVSGRVAEFTDVIASITADHGIAGRVVTSDGPDQATSIATLLETSSPFDATGAATADALDAWLKEVEQLAPDVLLLDYGTDLDDARHRTVLRRMHETGTLLIAAGGHGTVPTYPAHWDFVLAVGALGDDLRPREYSHWFAKVRKPDLYARDNLEGDPIAAAVMEQGPTMGTSFAAVRVLVAAVLVWAVDRTRSADDVRAFVLESADPLRGRRRTGHQRQLNVHAAIDAARANVVFCALKFGSLDPAGLVVATGLDSDVAQRLASSLVAQDIVRSSDDGRFELGPNSEVITDSRELARAVTS
jgi:hypothetical protein